MLIDQKLFLNEYTDMTSCLFTCDNTQVHGTKLNLRIAVDLCHQQQSGKKSFLMQSIELTVKKQEGIQKLGPA